MKFLQVISLVIYFTCLLIYSSTAFPLSKAKSEKNYRLPNTTKPHRYEIEFTIKEDAFITKIFEGNVKIDIEVATDTKQIQLHSSRQTIIHINLVKNDNDSVVSIPYITKNIDDDTNILTIDFVDTVTEGFYYLSIQYLGILGDDDLYGFYQSTYKSNNGEDHLLATTQFESVYARRAFPCFDEPKFKSVFSLKFKHPEKYIIVANTNAKASNTQFDIISTGEVITEFDDTPIMSSYLVAFVMSEFTSTSNDNNQFRVYSKPDSSQNRGVALKYGPDILKKLGEKTGVDYFNDMKMSKMDVIAIPDFVGAMENWGLVTSKEVFLLDDGVYETSEFSTQEIIGVLAHEFAHQWFGDYVTLDWWSDTWLNEAFATYFENLISDEVKPEFKFMEQFVVTVQQQIFQADSVKSALPLSSRQEDIKTPSEIENKFDGISYNKGGSIVRMMSYFLGQEQFIAGVKKYLNTMEHGNANPNDLWVNFQSPIDGVAMSDVMDNWVNKAGLPIVQVSLSSDTKITLSQERFLLSTEEQKDDTKWNIPISYTTNSSKSPFDTNPESYQWITSAEVNKVLEDKVSERDWLIVNNQATGYFRTNYDQNLWYRIIAALKSKDFEKINALNRAQLLDDIFNLARINKVDYKTVFNLADYLSQETNYYAWTSAINAFSFLLQRTGQYSTLGLAIREKMLSLMKLLYKNAMADNPTPSHIDKLNAVQAKTWACNVRNSDCLTKASVQFATYVKYGERPNPNDRGYVYCTALNNSGNKTGDWKFLRNEFSKTDSLAEQKVILNALGCTSDKNILKTYLEESIKDDSGIRKQDTATVFKSVYTGTPEGTEVAFEFLKENYKLIAEKYKGMNSLSTIIAGIADRFTEEEQINELKDFVNNESFPDDFKAAAQHAIETATANVKWLNTHRKDLEESLELTNQTRVEQMPSAHLLLSL